MASGSNTAIPTPTATPKPDPDAAGVSAREASEQVAELVACANGGSFSTLSQATSDENDVRTPELSASPEVNVKLELPGATTNSALAQNVDHMVKEEETMPSEDVHVKEYIRVNNGYTTGPLRRSSGYQEQSIPIRGSFVYNATNQARRYMHSSADQSLHQSHPYYNSSPVTNNPSPVLDIPQGCTILSAGSDPISEGRRIYIGNLKYSVNRIQIKQLLRQFGVNNTVEKIYMPYSDTPLEPSASISDDRDDQELTNNVPEAATFHDSMPSEQTSYRHHQYGGGECDLPNKGFAFVTYGDRVEAGVALERLSGVMHLDRRLVCRPGLPKGVAFNKNDQDDFYRDGKRRRERLFRDNQFPDYPRVVTAGGGAYYNRNGYAYNGGQHGPGGYTPRDSMGSGYNYGRGYGTSQAGGRRSMDSGYRSAVPSYSNDARNHQD